MTTRRYTHYPRTILWLVRGGTFTMGGELADEQPAFECEVAPFYLSKWPITNEQYEAFDPGYRRSLLSPGDRDSAVGIGYQAAASYARWYAEVSRKPTRLPTEIEWEYACRGDTASSAGDKYFWGDDPEEGDAYVWDAETSDGIVRAADAKKPNGFGLHSMLGGVWEWTCSPYRPYPLSGESEEERESASAAARVLRGGSFKTPRRELTCARRRCALPSEQLDDVGFRIVRPFRTAT